jgi:hypothetical protein
MISLLTSDQTVQRSNFWLHYKIGSAPLADVKFGNQFYKHFHGLQQVKLSVKLLTTTRKAIIVN